MDSSGTAAGWSGCRDSKGLRDLHALLTRPGTAVAALDLADAWGEGRDSAEATLRFAADTGEVIDAQARSAYRQRLRELEEAAAEADAAADIERSARVAAERDALVKALSAQAFGLGGRVRRGRLGRRARAHRGDRPDQGRDPPDRRGAPGPRQAPWPVRSARGRSASTTPTSPRAGDRADPDLTSCGPISPPPGITAAPQMEGAGRCPEPARPMPPVPSTSPRSRAVTPSLATTPWSSRRTRPTWIRLPSSRACRTTGASARTGAWRCPAGSYSGSPGHNEVYTAGDTYYGAPGHLPLLFAGTELVEFSPTGPLNESMAVIGKNLEAARSGGA